jgi:hypothetical protein
MDVTRLTTLGRGWQQRLRTVFDGPLEADATPLEIVQAVLDDVERHVEPMGRGRRVLPYTAIEVRVLAAAADIPRLEAVLDDLPTRVTERLTEIRCEPSDGLEVVSQVSAEPPAWWPEGQRFVVTYRRAAAAARETPDAPSAVVVPCLRLTVSRGQVAEGPLEFRGGTIAIGRCPDPTADGDGARRNRVAFLDDADGINATVGRAHARVRYSPDGGDYRLFDEGSRNGTSVLRDGEVIAVPRRDPRGVRLRDGDEIRLGRAVLQVSLQP